jgi:DNA-binding NarL/FixJ family response regulator
MNLKNEKTIIIADDHQLFAEGIFSMLNNTDYKVVGYAADGIALLSLLKGFVPDVVLLDINMPRMNGIESAKRIKVLFPSVKIIMLTMYTESGLYNAAIKNNFDGYLLKNIQRSELINAIEKVLKGEKVFPPIDNKNLKTNDSDQTHSIGAINSLTEREREVLKLIAGQLTMAEIATKLFLSQHTVETYRKNLLRKLNQRNMVGLAVLAVNNGIN